MYLTVTVGVGKGYLLAGRVEMKRFVIRQVVTAVSGQVWRPLYTVQDEFDSLDEAVRRMQEYASWLPDLSVWDREAGRIDAA